MLKSLAEIGVISHEISEQVRIGVSVVFIIAAIWVLRKDFKVFAKVFRDGLRASWEELEAEETNV